MAKRICSILLAVMLLASLLVVPASAEGYTITIKNEAAGHVYEAYQVFAAKELDDNGVLTDITWGEGVDGAALLAALKASDKFKNVNGESIFAGSSNAKEVANIMGGWSYNEPNVKHFADVVSQCLTDVCAVSGAHTGTTYVIDVEEIGYYFIMDTEAVEGTDAATDYLLQVIKSVEVSPKISAPTFHKTVNYELDSTYTDAIDAQIGDTVYFKLETKLPSLYNDYYQYRMFMQDVLPEGLEYVKVEDIYVAHAAGGHTSYLNSYVHDDATTTDVSDGKRYGFDEATRTLTVNFGDLKTTQQNPNLNDTFVVKYSAVVTADVVFGLAGDLGNKNVATMSFANNMNQTDAATADLGTITDTASVYVYQLNFNKQDSLTHAALKDAKFFLFRNIANPDGTTTKMYAHTDENGLIQSWSQQVPAIENALVSDEEGNFCIKGLDSLAYHLEEVDAPKGYNTMEAPVLITLSATISNQELTGLTCTADGTATTGDVADGSADVVVYNTYGSTLPATGGMGTTVFYVAGAALLLTVAVILIAKKRKEA